MTTNRAASNEMNVVQDDFEGFTSLWTALRTSYEGTNITKTVARLLNMYQPHDGILAYERLLRTLSFLLEDFDRQNLRLLVSMVPPPKGISEKCLNEVFHKATGFHRIDVSLFRQNSQEITTFHVSNLNQPDSNRDSLDNLQGNIINKCGGSSEKRNSPKILPTNSEVFRGFPPNEIFTTKNHVESVNHFCDSANCKFSDPQAYFTTNQDFQSVSGYRTDLILPSHFALNWFQNPSPTNINNSYQIAGTTQDLVFKTADNKFIKLPVSKTNVTYRPNVMHQKIQNESNNRGFADIRVLRHAPILLKKKMKGTNEIENFAEMNAVIGDKRILRDMELHQLEKELQVKYRALEREIQKMDIVYWNEENHNALADSQVPGINSSLKDNLTVSKTLRASVCNFLERVKKGIVLGITSTTSETMWLYTRISSVCVDVPTFPRTKPLSTEFQSISSEYPKLSTDFQHILKTENILMTEKRTEGPKKTVQKQRVDSTRKPKSQNIRQQNVKSQAFQMPHFSGDLQPFLKVENTSDNLSDRCMAMDSNSIGNLMPRLNSNADLASYKRHYYDTLLSVHRGKGNSFSSLRSPAGCDTCYLNYLHEHRELQQQQQFAMNPQFALHEVQPGLSNTQNSPYTWVRFNWGQSTRGQMKFDQQSETLHSSSFYSGAQGMVSQDTRRMDVRCFMQTNQETSPYFKRKKLEEIVVKLREGENSTLKQ